MRLSRFERKIIAAIAAVALVPLLGALLLGQRALSEAYAVGVNPRVRAQLEEGLELYRAHFEALKRAAQHAADAIAFDHALTRALQDGDRAAAEARLAELFARYPAVTFVRIEGEPGGPGDDGGVSGRDPAPLELRAARKAAEPERALQIERDGGAGRRLIVGAAAPAKPFVDYQNAGALVEVFGRLERDAEVVSASYLLVYMGFLLTVIVAALAVGIVLSRRVTRRVAVLADATARVGAGDLSVQVPTDARDEIGDLTHAFNAMVRDMRESRGRIEYLQRIGAWQSFARRLAHEIKNPLTPIQLAMQEAHRRYPGDDAAYRAHLDEALAIVEEEVATLRRLTGEFSAFARLPQASLAPADLGDFLADAARSLEAIPAEYGRTTISVRCQLSQAKVAVRIDAMMLKRCLDNLVRNAVQAFAEGAAGHVEVRVSRRDGRAVLLVEDDGPGVAEADCERIFDPYFTTKAEGTGLGLAIVKKVVLEHGGQVHCEPREGGGARFVIGLPEAARKS